ncbi:MAG: histidine phosphatase family protein [Pseudomonas profundi]|uniref:histidine phosphatase family protein n=1 Tax=Pseudomonas profundi TaxID=1981513 RepID=UPI00300318AD
MFNNRTRALIVVPLLTISWLVYTGLDSTPEPEEALQTLVFLRHAEKPNDGLGQLNCQGLNRSLALPALLPERFGAPDYVFAANPDRRVEEGPDDAEFNYLRPLLTIAPTAIAHGLPINTSFNANDVGDIVDELTDPQYRNSTIYTAWSRGYVSEIMNELLEEVDADESLAVDRWHREDFDSVYVIKLHWRNGVAKASLEAQAQGLNDTGSACPGEPQQATPQLAARDNSR